MGNLKVPLFAPLMLRLHCVSLNTQGQIPASYIISLICPWNPPAYSPHTQILLLKAVFQRPFRKRNYPWLSITSKAGPCYFLEATESISFPNVLGFGKRLRRTSHRVSEETALSCPGSLMMGNPAGVSIPSTGSSPVSIPTWLHFSVTFSEVR